MAGLHGFDFLLQLLYQLCLIGAVNQHLQAFFEKLVGDFLSLKRHHPVLTGDAGQFDHALDHHVLFFHRW